MIKEIPCYKGKYIATSEGEVFRRANDNTFVRLKPSMNEHGYMRVSLNGKTYKLHRVIALTFCPNPNGYPQVNHRDGNKNNNYADNLEWCTHKQNMEHAKENNLIRNGSMRSIIAFKDGESVLFRSILQASRILGVDSKSIREVLSGKRKTCKGYRFE